MMLTRPSWIVCAQLVAVLGFSPLAMAASVGDIDADGDVDLADYLAY